MSEVFIPASSPNEALRIIADITVKENLEVIGPYFLSAKNTRRIIYYDHERKAVIGEPLQPDTTEQQIENIRKLLEKRNKF